MIYISKPCKFLTALQPPAQEENNREGTFIGKLASQAEVEREVICFQGKGDNSVVLLHGRHDKRLMKIACL